MKEIIAETIRWLSQGRSVAWATVVSNSGSTPRQAGSRMLITPQGKLLGSVGGGKLEADTLALVDRLLPVAGRGVLEFRLNGRDASETDMICGGDATILVESLLADDLPFIQEMEKRVGQEGRVYMLTLIDEQQGTFAESHLLGSPEGWVSGGLPLNLAQKVDDKTLASLGQPVLFTLPDKGDRLLAEQFGPDARLILFGGGHVSLEVAWLADRLGFEVIVADDREEFANRMRFPMAQQILACPMDQAIENLSYGPGTYVVILTRGHLHDMEVLAKMVERETTYLGMIGSRRKREMIYAELLSRGVRQEMLNTVHSPIGIKMPAETPAEIAVSIVAELISVRAEQQSQSKPKKACCSSHAQPRLQTPGVLR